VQLTTVRVLPQIIKPIAVITIPVNTPILDAFQVMHLALTRGPVSNINPTPNPTVSPTASLLLQILLDKNIMSAPVWDDETCAPPPPSAI
jgi:hypothetical protein